MPLYPPKKSCFPQRTFTSNLSQSFFQRSALPCCLQTQLTRRTDELREQPPRKCIVRHPFRMPLHSNHPIVGRLQFHTFDNPVGAERSDEQFLSRSIDGLVVAAVDLHLSSTRKFFQLAAFSQSRAVFEVFGGRACRQIGFSVCIGSCLLRRNILYQPPALVHVHDLAAR